MLDLSSDASAEDCLTIAFGDAALTLAIFSGRLAAKTDGCHLLLSTFWQKAQEKKVKVPCVIVDRADGDEADVATGERFGDGRAGPFLYSQALLLYNNRQAYWWWNFTSAFASYLKRGVRAQADSRRGAL